MLYHSARLSLNRPFITPSLLPGSSPMTVTTQSKLSTQSMAICSDAISIILTLLARFRAQHSLRQAPLIFVHGITMAIDVTLASARQESSSGSTVLLNDTNLPTLDAALEELAYAWPLAREAKTKFRSVLSTRQVEKEVTQEVDGTRSD
jgi:hypothetical protein